MLSCVMLLATDLLALSVAGMLGMQAWISIKPIPPLYLKLWPALALFIVIFALEGLYPGVGIGPVEEMRRLVRGSSLVYLVLGAGIFLIKGSDLQSRGEMVSAWLLSILVLPTARALFHYYAAGKPWFGVPTIIFGSGESARQLIDKLNDVPQLALKPVACVDSRVYGLQSISGIAVYDNLETAAELAHANGVRYAIVAMPELKQDALTDLLEHCSLTFPHVYLVPQAIGLGSIPVSPIDVGGMLALEVRHNLLFAINRQLKRTLDLVLVLAAIPLALPAVLLSALAVFLVSRGNPFYLHTREGEGRKPIRILKLRTMYPNADAVLGSYLAVNDDARREWQLHCKLKHDPRVLPGVGAFLRRSSLDELPQLWNILTGDMSLVGPRPFPAYHNGQFQPAFRELRTRVRPGLTGLWQISSRSEANLEAQEMVDTYYIRNWSLWLDIYILSRTVRAVIVGKGAY
jgi:Undecaprenyl-phosphate galactose phosphotransferase WbaP